MSLHPSHAPLAASRSVTGCADVVVRCSLRVRVRADHLQRDTEQEGTAASHPAARACLGILRGYSTAHRRVHGGSPSPPTLTRLAPPYLPIRIRGGLPRPRQCSV